MKTFKNAPKFTKLQAFSAVIMRGDDQMILRNLLALQCDDDFAGVQWQKAFGMLADAINQKKPVFQLPEALFRGPVQRPVAPWKLQSKQKCIREIS